jgi:hypothetical protein
MNAWSAVEERRFSAAESRIAPGFQPRWSLASNIYQTS